MRQSKTATNEAKSGPINKKAGQTMQTDTLLTEKLDKGQPESIAKVPKT